MTRTRVLAHQATRPPRPARMLRGTVATVSPLTVQVAGGAAVAGVAVPGAVYTAGAAVLVMMQEPGVGPVYPIPGSTAVPASLLPGALILSAENLGALPTTGLVVGQLGTALDSGITYRWMGAVWDPWDSTWIGYSPTWTIPGATIFLAKSRYRYRGGAVLMESMVTLNAGPINGEVYVTAPTAIDAPSQLGDVARGTVTYRNASDGYRNYSGAFETDAGNSRFRLTMTGATGNATVPGYRMGLMSGPFNEAWAQSDSLGLSLEYDRSL